MGLRPHARRPITQARAGSDPRGVHRGAVRPVRSVAPHVGRGVHLQRLAHDPRLLRRAAASRLSGLRSHRGGRLSTDTAGAIARDYDVRLIRTPNRGLACARNTGLAAATGEIVAYLDDDAYPEPHWLTYLAATFLSTSHAGVGGPNIAPPGDGPIAEC